MDGPLKVFIYTNVFDSQHYNFNASKLLRLKQLTEEGKISLFLSDIVIGEARRHIIRNITDARNAFKKSYDKELSKQGYESWNTGEQAIRILKHLEKYSFLFRIFGKSLKSDMINDAITQFELYVNETNATIIDSSGIDVNNIVSDFFSERPPFEAKKEKRMNSLMLL